MERTKKAEIPKEPKAQIIVDDGKIWWKKVGGGSLRLSNKIIKPGERFRAAVSEIPLSFRDLVVPLEDIKEKKESRKIDVTKSAFKLQERGKNGMWWDVVSPTGQKDAEGKEIMKVINEKALRKEIAEKLISDLSR